MPMFLQLSRFVRKERIALDSPEIRGEKFCVNAVARIAPSALKHGYRDVHANTPIRSV
jgi:hypothetical protein